MNRPTIPEQALHGEKPARLGISSCLLGARVRYDGGHKHDQYVTDVLGEFFEWVPVCPEFEIDLGVPRPTIQLESGDPEPHLIEPISGDDLTERMESFAGRRLAEIEGLGLDGFILKSRSPSCGLEGVKVIDADRSSTTDGVGIFARVLAQKWPELPVAEEGWFGDDRLLLNFIERVLGHHRKRVASCHGLEAAHQALLKKLRVKV